jgi:hypothetical protein
MDLDKETAVFVGACEANQTTIHAMPLDSPAREAYAEGLADGVRFVIESMVAN